jgi:uncharacterized protein YbjT (DUF2867 family)
MKIVVIGRTGLIRSKLVKQLGERGHEAVAASPDSGVNTVTGQGLAEVLDGVAVVVDVSNSPSFDETTAMNFFTTATRKVDERTLVPGIDAGRAEIRFDDWLQQRPVTVAAQ